MGLLKKTAVDTADAPDTPATFDPSDLQNADPDIRRRAAQNLRDDADVAPLIAAIEAEPHRAVRAAIFNALREIGGIDVARGLASFLGSENTEIRNATVAVLKGLGADTGDLIPELLTHDDPDIRIMAIDILQDLGHASAPQWLGEVLVRDSHQNVVGAAIDRLVEIGTPDQCAALRSAAERFEDDPFIGFASAEAIRAIESGRSA